MPFQKGQSGNPKGRAKGSKATVTEEIRGLARDLFDKEYWKRTKEKLIKGELHPKLETTLLAYAYGAPQQEHTNQNGVTVNLGFIALPATSQAPDIRALPPSGTTTLEAQVINTTPQVMRQGAQVSVARDDK